MFAPAACRKEAKARSPLRLTGPYRFEGTTYLAPLPQAATRNIPAPPHGTLAAALPGLAKGMLGLGGRFRGVCVCA